jgi:hypothetical protein
MKDTGQLPETLNLLKQGLCKEIPGVALTVSPKYQVNALISKG